MAAVWRIKAASVECNAAICCGRVHAFILAQILPRVANALSQSGPV